MNKERIKHVADKLRKGNFQVPIGIKTEEAKIVADKLVEYLGSVRKEQGPAIKAKILEQAKTMSKEACAFLKARIEDVEVMLK